MDDKFLEKYRIDIMNYVKINEFPQEETEDTKLWIKAIALVRKHNSTYAYANLVRNPDMSYSVEHINGSMSPIASYEKIYPYLLLDVKYIKGFRGNGYEPRVEYLKSLSLPYLNNVDLTKMTLADLNKEIVGAAVYLQLNDLKKNKYDKQ